MEFFLYEIVDTLVSIKNTARKFLSDTKSEAC